MLFRMEMSVLLFRVCPFRLAASVLLRMNSTSASM